MLLLAGVALGGCGHLLAAEAGIGYGGGWIGERSATAPMIAMSIGTGNDSPTRRGYSCGVGGTAALAPIQAVAGGGAFRWDGTLGTPPPDEIAVLRWSFAIEGFAAGGDGKDLTLGIAGFTGPTFAVLTREGMGMAISVGPANMWSIEPMSLFGAMLRIKLTLGPFGGPAGGWC